MYDEYSFARLLSQAQFADIRRVAHLQSRIPDWASYRLDNNADGSPYKPDPLYVECVMPALSGRSHQPWVNPL